MSTNPYNPMGFPGDSNVQAAAKVSGPATGLMVTGGLGILAQLLGALANIALMSGMIPQQPNAPDAGQMAMFQGVGGLIGAAVAIIMGVVVIMGAMKMKNLESYGFAMASSIIAMIPCISPCCILGLPIGIWALVTLNDAGVKSAFTR